MNDDDLILISCFVFGWFVSSAIGYLIGRTRKREAFGLLMGFLLGPIGWLIVALLPKIGAKCPSCLGVVNDGATKCVHCGSSLGKYRDAEPDGYAYSDSLPRTTMHKDRETQWLLDCAKADLEKRPRPPKPDTQSKA